MMPLVLVHGAIADGRIWDRHRALLEPRYDVVTPTLRYFGPGEWDPAWPPFGVRAHTDDLIATLEEVGRARVVGWSYGAHVVLQAAVERPDLVSSVFAYEPGMPVFLSEAELAAWSEDAGAAFGPVFEAVRQGDVERGVRLLLDAAGQREGYLDTQPEASRRIQLENARTLPLQLDQAPAPELTGAQLAALPMPVRVACGARSSGMYRVVTEAAARWLGQPPRFVPGATHMWPDEDVAAFAALAAHAG